MNPARPKLIIVPGAAKLDEGQMRELESSFDVEQPEDGEDAQRLIAAHPSATIMGPADAVGTLLPAQQITLLQAVEDLCQGAGLVDASGSLRWMSRKLARQDQPIRDQFAQLCVTALERWDQPSDGPRLTTESPCARFNFTVGERSFDLVVTPVSRPGSERGDERHESAIAVLLEAPAARRMQDRMAAVEAAGRNLVHFDASSIADQHAAERLRALEAKIIAVLRAVFSFEHFEVRLINRRTNQLELVTAVGIAPMNIGEAIYAQAEGNGICGHVAVTGRSYLCTDTRTDPLYREGLEGAACSLTVPLLLDDHVLGVLNVESQTPDRFTDEDRQLAEVFCRYLAVALNTLDLLVIERFTATHQISQRVLSEIRRPLDAVNAEITALMADRTLGPEARAALQRINTSTTAAQARAEQCAAGPRTILELEQVLHGQPTDPTLLGKRVLVADDEPMIRQTVAAILEQRGCDVTICADGHGTIQALESSAQKHAFFDLVLSDIRMPDRNGYEVFRFAKAVCPETAVILMTGFGYDPHHSIVRSSQEGLHSFLFKPFKASQLLDEVGKALSQRVHA